MAKDRGPLGSIADRVGKESPIPVFECLGLPGEEGNRVRWDGKDVGEFLSLAKRVEATMIYLCEGVVAEDEEGEDHDHVGETSFVEVAFLVDGKIHILAEVAEWATSDELDLEEGLGVGAERSAEPLEARKDELVAEFLADLQTHPLPLDFGTFGLEERFRRFVAVRLEVPGVSHDGSPLDLLVQKVAGEIAMDLSARQAEADRAKIEPLVTECAEWASKSGLTSLSMGDVQVFLDEKRVQVSRQGVRLLWMKAKVALKSERGSSR